MENKINNKTRRLDEKAEVNNRTVGRKQRR